MTYYTLTTKKTVKENEPLTGKFYGLEWVDGETIEPLTNKQAFRIARIRGCQVIEFTKSKEYERRNVMAPVIETKKKTKSFVDKLKSAAKEKGVI